MRKIGLTRFEALAERLIEDSFKRLLGGRLEAPEVAARLAKALEDSQQDGRAADHFTVHLNPDDFEAIETENERLAEDLSAYLTRLAQQVGVTFPLLPEIEIISDETIARHKIDVVAKHLRADKGFTTQLHRIEQDGEEAQSALQAIDAFLIIEGRSHFLLDKPLLTLGRRTDNDLVLESPGVSRRHAQIRWRFGRFVLYDVGGRGRTLVNGRVVTEYVLRPGDVIALSNVLLLYGEGRDGEERSAHSAGEQTGQTQILPKL